MDAKCTCLLRFVARARICCFCNNRDTIAYNFKVYTSLGQYLIPVSARAMRIVGGYIHDRRFCRNAVPCCRAIGRWVYGPFKSICRHARVRATREAPRIFSLPLTILDERNDTRGTSPSAWDWQDPLSPATLSVAVTPRIPRPIAGRFIDVHLARPNGTNNNKL